MSSAIDSIPFLTVEGQPVSVGQAFLCLQLFGRLQPFVQDFLRHYTIYRELQIRDDIEVASVELGQTIFDLRVREDLTDPNRFGQWLSSRGIDYPMFEQQVLISLKLEKLKNCLAEEGLQALFDGSKSQGKRI